MNIIAISDLHLGTQESVLYQNPNGIRRFFNQLQNEVGPVDILILVGDFLDFSLGNKKGLIKDSKEFFKIAFRNVNANIVYIPGNHDHILWSRLRKRMKLSHAGKCVDPEYFIKLFMDEKIPDNKHLIISYPEYAIRSGEDIYVFTHGHIFWDIIHHIAGSFDPFKYDSLTRIEKRVRRAEDFLWYWNGIVIYHRCRKFLSAKINEYIKRQARPYRKVRKRKKREAIHPDPKKLHEDNIKEHKKFARWYVDNETKYYKAMVQMMNSNDQNNEISKGSIGFVLGHTHDGGMFEWDYDGRTINIFNTGGWLNEFRDEEIEPQVNIFVLKDGASFLYNYHIRENRIKLISRAPKKK